MENVIKYLCLWKTIIKYCLYMQLNIGEIWGAGSQIEKVQYFF